jgi:N-acetylglutamate synthase-like GNAT family acetyltransferase
VRGQKLFVRPIEAGDSGAVAELLCETDVPRVPSMGLIGKLAGKIVAVAALSLTADAVHIDDLVVAAELRRKWIGRLMVDEVESLAQKMERSWITAQAESPIRDFLVRVGFAAADSRLQRRVRGRSAGAGS